MNGGSVTDRWRITEIETGRLLTGLEMKKQLQCRKTVIKVQKYGFLSYQKGALYWLTGFSLIFTMKQVWTPVTNVMTLYST